MRVMGIDQSFTSTGIVIVETVDREYSEDAQWEFEMVHCSVYKTKKVPGSLDHHQRAYDIAWHLSEVAAEYEVDHINLEGISYRAHGNATRDLAGLLFVIVFQLNKNEEYPIDIVPPNTLKKYGTGVGFAKKLDMIKALPQSVLDRFQAQNYRKTTGLEDLADAYWLSMIYFKV